MTAQELLQYSHEPFRTELIRGRLVEMEPAGALHGAVAAPDLPAARQPRQPHAARRGLRRRDRLRPRDRSRHRPRAGRELRLARADRGDRRHPERVLPRPARPRLRGHLPARPPRRSRRARRARGSTPARAPSSSIDPRKRIATIHRPGPHRLHVAAELRRCATCSTSTTSCPASRRPSTTCSPEWTGQPRSMISMR